MPKAQSESHNQLLLDLVPAFLAFNDDDFDLTRLKTEKSKLTKFATVELGFGFN